MKSDRRSTTRFFRSVTQLFFKALLRGDIGEETSLAGSALVRAIEWDRWLRFKLLIAAGADVNAEDRSGWTALDSAKLIWRSKTATDVRLSWRYERYVKALVAAGADASGANSDRRHTAAIKRKQAEAEEQWRSSPDVAASIAKREAKFAYEQAQEALGRELKSARERAGLSVPNAATRAGIDESFWYKVERDISFPTHEAFVKMAKAVGVDSEQLEPAYRRSYRSQAPLL
jgi:ribosome-binding protein aMBF1 (putative translation factor)